MRQAGGCPDPGAPGASPGRHGQSRDRPPAVHPLTLSAYEDAVTASFRPLRLAARHPLDTVAAMTYDPNGQYPPPNQDPNAGGMYPTSGPGYPTSGAGYPTGGAAPASGGPYPPQGGDPYQGGGYQAGGYQASTYPTSGYPGGGYDANASQAGGYQGGEYQGGGYQGGGYQAGGYQAGAVDPVTGQPLSDKTKLAAGLLGIFLGGFGVGRFYTGHVGMAIGQICATWLTCGIGGIWPLIDGIMILANGGTDAQGRKLRDS
jgi:TM2 domain-containing membrane protein YozV